MKVWIAIALGGALGSVARHAVGIGMRAVVPGWPWGTVLVNVLGSFAIGMLFAVMLVRPAPDMVRVGLATGLLGGFTTFSAFSLDAMSLMRDQGLTGAGSYVLISVLGGLAACALGLWVGRLVLA